MSFGFDSWVVHLEVGERGFLFYEQYLQIILHTVKLSQARLVSFDSPCSLVQLYDIAWKLCQNPLTIEHMFYYNDISLSSGAGLMSKLIGEPIKVHRKEDSSITAFIWRKRLYQINEIIGWWREPAKWWDGKMMRLFVRVTATNSSTGAYELCKLGEAWFLSRVLD